MIASLVKTTLRDRSLQNLNRPESQKLLNEKAIATLVKTTQSEQLPWQKPTDSEVQKLANDKAIATLAKTTQSDRYSCKNYTVFAIAPCKTSIAPNHKSYSMKKRSLLSLKLHTRAIAPQQKPSHSELQKLPNNKAIATLAKTTHYSPPLTLK